MRTAALKSNEPLDRQLRMRRRIRIASYITLLLVAAAPACIFDSGSYQGGGRTGSGAATAGTASDTSTSTDMTPSTGSPTDTTTSTSTSTSMGDMDSGSMTAEDAKEGG
jgi:hypothetical protein